MAVKLVPRAQVVAQEGRRPGPVNALAFKRSEVSRRSEIETEKEFQRKTPRTRRSEPRGKRSPSPVALTDEDSESSRPMRRYPARRSALRRPGTAHLGRKRLPDGRHPPRVSRRVRQLQAQHEDELWRKRKQKKIEMKKMEKRKREEREQREEREEVHQKSQDFKSVQEALPPQQSSLPEFERRAGLNEERASRVQRDPEKQRAPPRPSKAKHVAKQLKPSGEKFPVAEGKAPAVAVGEAKSVPLQTRAPALALRRWRQARKRQNLLRQITAMRGEMKLERRQLVSALQKPFNLSSLEAEVQQQNRELKLRFQKFYTQMSSSRRVLKVLAAEHTELQRAFVRLMNECGFARPSALRMSPKTEAGNTHDDQDDQNGQNGQDEDDDVIVEGDIEENQVQEQNEDREKLKKEMQREALRAELLLRALDAEGSV